MPKKTTTKAKPAETTTALANTEKRQITAIAKATKEAMDFVASLCPTLPQFYSQKDRAKLERFVNTAFVEIQRNPKLMNCDRLSMQIALERAASLKLEIGGGLQQCWLVPFRNNKKGITECQLIQGYRGKVLLVLRNSGGLVKSINAQHVREKDLFEYELGTKPFIRHIKADEPSPLCKAYAVAELTDGAIIFKVLLKREVMTSKKISKSSSSKDSPWNKDETEPGMWDKTAIHALAKVLPISSPEWGSALEFEMDTIDFGKLESKPQLPEGQAGNQQLEAALNAGDPERLTVEMAPDEEAPAPKKEEEPRQQFNPEECTYCNEKLDTETKSDGSVVGYCKNKKCDNWMRKVEI